jgi:hypothetical protein
MAQSKQELKPIEKILTSISTEQARKTQLDVRLHFVPMQVSILKMSLGDKLKFDNKKDLQEILNQFTDSDVPDKAKFIKEAQDNLNSAVEDFEQLRNKIIQYIKDKHKNSVIISGTTFKYNGEEINAEQLKALAPCVVYENAVSDNNIIGAVYSSYNSARSGLFTNFLNTEISKLLKKEIYEGSGYIPGFDIGHILGDTELTGTPISRRVDNLIQKIDSFQEQSKYSSLLSNIANVKTDLRARSSYGASVEATFSQDTRTALARVGVLVVIIQERKENQYSWGALIESAFGNKIKNFIINLGFSDSLIQVIEKRIVESIKFGKTVTTGKLKPGGKVVIDGKKNTKPVKIAITSSSLSNTPVKVPKKLLSKAKIAAKTTNLVQLQNLINQSLVEQVKRNMGRGERRDVLNLRTGRFAESVRVERMTESRQGMITAFYSYMKNPYQTFELGFQQGLPKSRDPKLLIARSIREIATQQVANRLRSVSV